MAEAKAVVAERAEVKGRSRGGEALEAAAAAAVAARVEARNGLPS